MKTLSTVILKFSTVDNLFLEADDYGFENCINFNCN